MQADRAVDTVRLWFDSAGRRCSGYGEAVVRLCGQLVKTVARECLWPIADQHEPCDLCCIRHVCLIRGISPNGVHKYSTLSPVNTLSLQDRSASAVYGHNHC